MKLYRDNHEQMITLNIERTSAKNDRIAQSTRVIELVQSTFGIEESVSGRVIGMLYFHGINSM